MLEETVERRVREERVLWEGRVRGLEARVRELETKTGTADYNEEPMSRPPTELASKQQHASNHVGASATAFSKPDAVVERAEDGAMKPASRERSPIIKQQTSSVHSNKDDEEGDQLQDD